jgi:nicotinamidase/pyrazinamidase
MASPARIRYDPATALIVVDVQNDFADPRGTLSVKGGMQVAERCSAEAWRASQAGALVAYTQDWHPPSTPHFAKDGGIWPVHCVAGTWGAEFHPALELLGPIVRKGTNGEDGYSGFTMRDPITGETIATELEALLRERDIERVVVSGLATDYCVNATAIDARRLGFATEVLEDAIAGVNLKAGDSERAKAAMAEAGCTFGKLAGGAARPPRELIDGPAVPGAGARARATANREPGAAKG